MSDEDRIVRLSVDRKVLLACLEPLRLAHIYAFKGTEFEKELGPDFKPWKWDGHEDEYALDASRAYLGLLEAMNEALGMARREEVKTTFEPRRQYVVMADALLPDPEVDKSAWLRAIIEEAIRHSYSQESWPKVHVTRTNFITQPETEEADEQPEG